MVLPVDSDPFRLIRDSFNALSERSDLLLYQPTRMLYDAMRYQPMRLVYGAMLYRLRRVLCDVMLYQPTRVLYGAMLYQPTRMLYGAMRYQPTRVLYGAMLSRLRRLLYGAMRYRPTCCMVLCSIGPRMCYATHGMVLGCICVSACDTMHGTDKAYGARHMLCHAPY
eukprot:531324-Rhodomonas_salina.1